MHFIQPTQIWLSFRAKNLHVTSHETLLLGVGKLGHVTAPSRLRDNAQIRRFSVLQLHVWLTRVWTKLSFLRK